MFRIQFVDTFMAYLPTKLHAVISYVSLVIVAKLKAIYIYVSLSLHYVVLQYTTKYCNRSCIFLENVTKHHEKIQCYV
jgi:hypothetical protein